MLCLRRLTTVGDTIGMIASKCRTFFLTTLAVVQFVVGTAAFPEPSLTQRAAAEMSRRHYKEAIRLADQAIKVNPNDGDAHLTRAMSLAILDSTESAAKDFEIGLRLSPPTGYFIYYQAAACFASVGDYEKALVVLDKSIAIKPTADAYRQKGDVLWSLKRHDEAFTAFEKSIQLDPKQSYWVLFDRASCYMQASKNVEAVKDLTKIIEMKPNEPRGYALRAKVYTKLGKNDLAEHDRKRCEELNLKNYW